MFCTLRKFFLLSLRQRPAVLLASLAVGLTALIVMVGWSTESAPLIRIMPHFPAMVFNTALGFFLCAVGLLFVYLQKRIPAIFFGLSGALIGILNLFEYAFRIDLGIDELIFTDFIQSNAAHPGRMSISTALCFLFTGSSLALFSIAQRFLTLFAFLEMLCVFTALISAISLLDHIGLIHAEYNWFLWDSMAIHTSLCFVILNTALISSIWGARDRNISLFYVTVPFFFLTCAIILDVYTPLGIATGFAYTPFVLSAFWRECKLTTPFIFALVATILIILGFYVSADVGIPITSVLINRGGAVMEIWIVATLIYTIKLRDNAIRDNAERLNAIVDNTVDGLVTVDDTGIIEHCNRACEDIFGYPPKELIGQNIRTLMPTLHFKEHRKITETRPNT
ncbi:MAG: PAS domain S-box protein [Alphaproteobacteria bacterium]|nr:PAS domain S-box protein [Alphaproteobacteria bacterium]